MGPNFNMTSILLEKEKEFHKLNAELEIRTKALMHEVDSVMRMQSNLLHEAQQQKTVVHKIQSPTRDRDVYNQNAGDKWETYEENVHKGPSVFDKCLKAKITVLQNELDVLKTEYKEKISEQKQLQATYLKLEEERNKFQMLAQSYKEKNEKYTNQISNLNNKLQARDTELAGFRKENESLKKELKTLTMNNANNEAKVNKLLKDHEKSKTSLVVAKHEEKELKDSYKKQINELMTQKQRLEKQVTDLTNGFRKQMLLVDNLKKQKMYLESAKLIQISGEEFTKILDWKPSKMK